MSHTIPVRNYELDRSEITLNNTIGVGQFGDVYIGTYHTKVKCGNGKGDKNDIGNSAIIQVAVKTCKTNDDPEKMERFLEEACKYSPKPFEKTLHLKCPFFCRCHAKIRSSPYYPFNRHMQ